MKDTIDINGYSDEELLQKYTVEVNGRKYIRARILQAIGKRQAETSQRKPGEPGTVENPVFKNGHAYVYGSMNRLIMWEDYDGPIPDGDGIYFTVNLEETEFFTLTHDMKPTNEQKRMIHDAKKMPVRFTEDCPKSNPEQLVRFIRFGKERNMLRTKA